MLAVAAKSESADFRGCSVNNTWTQFAACAVFASLLPVLARLRTGLAGTALSSAWGTLVTAWLVWLIIAVVTLPPSPLRPWADSLWFLAAVVALVPPIAVLGARRPTSRVWTWFVLAPLVLVFAWPVLPVMTVGARADTFNLETPVVVGYGLVLIMGAGNYLGLAHTVSALLWMAGLLLVVLPLCPATNAAIPGVWPGRLWGTFFLAAAGWIADRQAARLPIWPASCRSCDSIAPGPTSANYSESSGRNAFKNGSTTMPGAGDSRYGWVSRDWKTHREDILPAASIRRLLQPPNRRSAGCYRNSSTRSGSIGRLAPVDF